MKHNVEYEEPIFKVTDDYGETRTCRLHAFKKQVISERGVLLLCWFISVIYNPSFTTLYGPYIFGELDGNMMRDDKVEPLNAWAEAKLEELVARATGKKYQETPFLRLDGAYTPKKVYKDEP